MATEVKRDRGWGRWARVAALFVVGLAFTALSVYQVGAIFDVFASRYPLVTLAPNAAGLREGAPVTLAGRRVGQVDQIEFIPLEVPSGDDHVAIWLSIDENVRPQIRADSRAVIRSQGLLGDKYVDIAPGSPARPVLSAGDTLPSAEAVDLESVLASAAETLEETRTVIADVRGITGVLARGEGTLGQLLVDEGMYVRLEAATGQLADLLRSVNRSEGTFGRLVHDPALYERSISAMARLDTVTSAALHADGTFGRLLRDDALYAGAVGAVAKLDSALVSVDALLARADNGDGTLQRLVQDPALYDELLKAVVDLQILIMDIRQNPQKYAPGINVDIF